MMMMEFDSKMQGESLVESAEAAISLAEFGEHQRRLEKVHGKDVDEGVDDAEDQEEGKREEGRRKEGRTEGGRREEGELVESAGVEAEENVVAEIGEEDEDVQMVGKEEDVMYGQNAWLVQHCSVQCLLAGW